MITTLMAAMSSFFPEANPAYHGPNVYKDQSLRDTDIIRVLGCAPTIAAACNRHKHGLEFNKPDPNAGYMQSFCTMTKMDLTIKTIQKL